MITEEQQGQKEYIWLRSWVHLNDARDLLDDVLVDVQESSNDAPMIAALQSILEALSTLIDGPEEVVGDAA